VAASFDEELLAAGRQFNNETLRAMAVYGVQRVKYELNEIQPVITSIGLTPDVVDFIQDGGVSPAPFGSFQGSKFFLSPGTFISPGPLTWGGATGFAKVDKIAREWPEPSPPMWTSDFWDYADLADHILEDRK
jgi:hypothetical protein